MYNIYIIYIYTHIHSEVMKTIQCAHPRHHQNGFCGKIQGLDGQWRSSHIVSVSTNRVFNKHQARSVDTLINRHKASSVIHSEVIKTIQCTNPLSPQWLFGNMPALNDHWQISCIVSISTNSVLNKYQAKSVNTLIKTEIGYTECFISTRQGA